LRPLLYLDTARLGQMSPAAKDAQIDFVRLSAEEPSSLYFEEFLRGGFNAWPSSYQNRFPGLRTWHGVAALKQSLRRLAGAPDDRPVLLASRSLSLVQLAARSMFRVCRNVLTTDLSWPTYQQAVEMTAVRTGNRTTTTSLRDDILYRGWTADDVALHLAIAFEKYQCDGLFLPAVDHLGIRLPIRKIVNRIRERAELRFCFIDAAQAFCHVPFNECVEAADFIVVGSHKWMGAYLPTGIGLFGQSRTRELIDHRLQLSLRQVHHHDPLLNFTDQLASARLDGHSETTNLPPLFACAGASSDLLGRSVVNDAFPEYQLNSVPVPNDEWQPLRPSREFRSQIVLYENAHPAKRFEKADVIRNTWLNSGSVITAYNGGLARISLPPNRQQPTL
jgi:hypothetical protein